MASEDVIEWRASRLWAAGWLLFVTAIALPALAGVALLAYTSIAQAPAGAWSAYLFFLYALVTLILGVLLVALGSAALTYAALIGDDEPVLRADRNGLQLSIPFRPVRSVRWRDVSAIEIERSRRDGRSVRLLNHVVVRLRDGDAPELAITPAMMSQSLESAHEKLTALWAQRR